MVSTMEVLKRKHTRVEEEWKDDSMSETEYMVDMLYEEFSGEENESFDVLAGHEGIDGGILFMQGSEVLVESKVNLLDTTDHQGMDESDATKGWSGISGGSK